jgi:SAM-dependent methyltransferase
MAADEGFEPFADDWVKWARTPGHDAYWQFRDRFFDEIVPASGHRMLEIGCGEGRVARDLKQRGHRLVAVDASPTLIRYAQDADPKGDYRVADAASLPFDDATFDCVVAYNSLMDVEDMPSAIREAARVLQPGGRLCICVTHPTADAGAFGSRAANAPFVISGSYVEKRRISVPVERDGLRMTFSGWAYSLEHYARAFEAAGLAIDRVREPTVSAEVIGKDPAEGRWARIPNFLFLRCLKR